MWRLNPGVRLLLGWAALLASGCGTAPLPSPGREPAATPLRVAAASDLQSVLPVLSRQFTDQTGIQMTPIFGSSGQLAEQIKAGAPFDVFLAANRSFVEDLAAAGLIRPDSVRPYARGSLVLAVHREAGAAIASLADLTRPEVKKIALANPAFAPYGKAGKQALERAGLWPQLEAKIVPSDSVRQALVFVTEGNAEAGLVGRALADVPEIRVVAVDPALYDPIVQGLGIVARTAKPREAESFARFLLSNEGQAILARFGFSGVAPEAAANAHRESAANPPPRPQPAAGEDTMGEGRVVPAHAFGAGSAQDDRARWTRSRTASASARASQSGSPSGWSNRWARASSRESSKSCEVSGSPNRSS